MEWAEEAQNPRAGHAEFIVAKHRNGGLDNIRLKFEGHLGRFANLDEYSSGGYLPMGVQEYVSKMNENVAFDALPMTNPAQAFGAPSTTSTDDDIPY